MFYILRTPAGNSCSHIPLAFPSFQLILPTPFNFSYMSQWFDKSSLLLTVTKHTALGHTEASTQLARGLPVSLVAGL